MIPLFGGNFSLRGMLLVTDFEILSPYLDAIDDAGYGVSVLGVPWQKDESSLLDGVIEVLRDWGWAGTPENEPPWM